MFPGLYTYLIVTILDIKLKDMTGECLFGELLSYRCESICFTLANNASHVNSFTTRINPKGRLHSAVDFKRKTKLFLINASRVQAEKHVTLRPVKSRFELNIASAICVFSFFK